MLKPPSRQQLEAVVHELIELPTSAQRSLGGGIYLRLDSCCNARFVLRWRRLGVDRSFTLDTWDEAATLRAEIEGVVAPIERWVRSWR